ncbi:MAG: ROK family protein [Actinomycetota bacterium]
MSARAVCIEIGGGSIQTVVFDNGTPRFVDGPHEVPGAPLLIAVPGLIEGTRVLAASNLGWLNADPVEKLGLQGPLHVLRNDAEAAALGEAVLRGATDLAYVGLGTGVGGAIVRDGVVVAANLFGHDGEFGNRICPCGRTGCLETVAAGWALPERLEPTDIVRVAKAVASVLRAARAPKLIVVAGGMSRRYPEIARALADVLPEHAVEASRAPAQAKSAAAWGLLRLAGLS